MNNFFNEEDKQLIAPDYSEIAISAGETDFPTEDDGDDDNISDIDEFKEENENLAKENNNMVTNNNYSPFSQPTPQWGAGNVNTSTPSYPTWGSSQPGNNNNSGGFWGAGSQSTQTPSWGAGNSWGSSQQVSGGNKVAIDRTKKVIITDFLDIIVTTYESNGRVGRVPRDIYDILPRFDVWDRLAAFSPEKIYMLAPINLFLGTATISAAWQTTFDYCCLSISSYLRLPYHSCQIIAQNMVGVPKSNIISSIIENADFPIERKDVVCIGVNSGGNGQSNKDRVAAEACGIDYIDLYQLLYNMY